MEGKRKGGKCRRKAREGEEEWKSREWRRKEREKERR